MGSNYQQINHRDFAVINLFSLAKEEILGVSITNRSIKIALVFPTLISNLLHKYSSCE
jgi:hypothetical protein